MLVQIYSFTHPDDVRAAVEAGVDNLGVAAGDQDVPAAISNDRARELFALVPDDRTTCALTVHTDVDAIVDYARAVEPDVLHVCSDTEVIGVDAVAAIRERVPEVDLMKAVEVAGPSAVDAAERFAPVSDWLILDTATDDVEGVGASGDTHDWSVSREVVERVDVPVVLAGGLGPDNVAEAVRAVRPAAVDSYSHTSRSERRKDHGAVRAFVENARAAAGDPASDD